MGPTREALLIFPAKFFTDEIEDIVLDQEFAEYNEFEEMIYIHDRSAWFGHFEYLEKLLIQKKIPFNRYSEGVYEDSHSIVRIYRPENDYDEVIKTDNFGKTFIHAKDVYELLKQYTKNEIKHGELLIKLTKLVEESDPILVKKVNRLSDYVKGENNHD